MLSYPARDMGRLALLALLRCASSLLLHSKGPDTSEHDGFIPSEWLNAIDQEHFRQRKPLPLASFSDEWYYRHSKEPHLDTPLPTGLQVVMALPLRDDAQSDGYWQVVRRTWANQRGVCILGKDLKQQDGCQVYVVRVVANQEGWQPNMDQVWDSTRPAAPTFYGYDFEMDGRLRLNMTENMRRGKTFRLLQTLSNTVSWATHIAKVDVDAYPYMYRFMSSLASHSQSCGTKYQYAGVRIYLKHCARKRPLPKNMTNACQARMGGGEDMPECAYFNNGGLYVLSADLARHITQPGGNFDRYCCEGPEDSTVGGTIFFHVKDCVASWSLLGSVHHATGEGGSTINRDGPGA